MAWVVPPDHLVPTGRTDPARLAPRFRPVLGPGTLVRLLDRDTPRDLAIAGELAVTGWLWSTDSDEPEGYSVHLPGGRHGYSVGFEDFDIVRGGAETSSTTLGWVEDPDPLDWPPDGSVRRGELVSIQESGQPPRAGIVTDYLGLGDDGAFRFRVWVEGEPVMPVVSEAELVGTGMVEPDRLPPRLRPVLGDGTVVRVRETARTRELGIAGELALTANLHWSPGREPAGYAVRLPGEARLHLVPFGAFTVVRGNLPGL